MDEVRARVVRQEKGLYTLCWEGRELPGEISGSFRHGVTCLLDYPAVGDYVTATWPEDGSHAIISGLFSRKSVFTRKASGSMEEQVVAANIDTVFLCMSCNQDFNLRRLERYVAIAWDSGAAPVVVLTKADLCGDVASLCREVEQVAAGVDVVTTSAMAEDIAGVMEYLRPGKTVAFVGSSGVGKSTLINRILGMELLKTAAIRADDDKGRHTTTHRELITLPNGAAVIDTPGMRELGLVNHEEGIDTAFRDVEALQEQCRFANCTHRNEPGCRIRAAITEGTLSMERWLSYQKLVTENRYQTDSQAYLKTKNEKFKEIARINRRR